MLEVKGSTGAGGEPELRRASETFTALRDARGNGLTMVRFVIPHRSAIVAALRYVRSLPVLEVNVSDAPQGRDLSAHLRHRRMGVRPNRWAVSVLELPVDPELYLRGKRRQAVRTNLRRAESLGVTWTELHDPREATTTVRDLLASRVADREWALRTAQLVEDQILRGVTRIFVSHAPGEEPKAVASVIVDHSWARMTMCVTALSEDTYPHRYVLNVGIARQLAAEGVRYLFVGNMLTLPPGLQYFQYLLGYQPVNLVVKRRSRTRPDGAPLASSGCTRVESDTQRVNGPRTYASIRRAQRAR